MIDRGCHVLESPGPAAAVAHAAILDVPHGPAAPHEIARQAAHHDLAIAHLPGAAVDQDHHWVRARAPGQIEIGALRAMRTVAMALPRREDVDDQARASHELAI